MDINNIKEILKAFDNSTVTSFKLEDENGKIELKKNISESVKVTQTVINDVEDTIENGTYVKSPIVGIAYKSSKPGADPFVNVGQKVTKGQTLCIVEAMKMFNEIKSTVSGEITAVLFEDGQLVEFDSPLFEIKE